VTTATRRRRLPDGTMRQTPTVREVRSVGKTWDDRYIVELQDDTLSLRPKGCRRGGPASCTISWGSLAQHLAHLKLEQRARDQKRARKARRRGSR